LERYELAIARAAAEVDDKTQLYEKLKQIKDPTPEVTDAMALVAKQTKEGLKKLSKAREELKRERSMPREIYKRDVMRDSIATVAKLIALMLCEFVMQEYFTGPRCMFRTFITRYMQVPLTVITTHDTMVFRLEANARSPDHTNALRAACAEINKRRLRCDDRLMIYEVVESLAGKP
jgi:hypothetical protein